jgi:alpha-1,3-rhamnosyl/mannosyltransferase
VADAFFGNYPKPDGKPYILFVGTIEPRKNVCVLLDDYERLPQAVRREYDLVVAGSPGWGDPGVLERLKAGIEGVRYVGYVPESDLPALNAGASLFVYPSLYEGFGLPVAQAMAAGVPVVTSNVSSLPEVAGEGGLLVDPDSPDQLCQAFVRVLEDDSLRNKLAANGRDRAQKFRWSHCAHESVRYFERLIQRQPPALIA